MRIIKEETELKSVIGQGYAYIYKDKHGMDSLSVFKKNIDEVYCLNSLSDWEKHKNKNCVLVVNGPGCLWANPVIDGKIIRGMFGGCFIYTSNKIVMKGYSNPIKLMDRVER